MSNFKTQIDSIVEDVRNFVLNNTQTSFNNGYQAALKIAAEADFPAQALDRIKAHRDAEKETLVRATTDPYLQGLDLATTTVRNLRA